MKICLLTWNYWPGLQGGAERQCRRLVQELVQQGLCCTVLTRRFSYHVAFCESDEGVHIQRVGWFSPIAEGCIQTIRKIKHSFTRGLGETQIFDSVGPAVKRRRRMGLSVPFMWLERLFFMGSVWCYLARRRNQFSCLHVQESHWIAGFGAWLGAQFGLPVIVKEASFPVLMSNNCGVPFASFWNRWRLRPLYLAQTEEAAKALAEKGVQIAAVIPNGVELPREQADVRGGRYVLYVGNLYQGAEWKAFDVLFDTWKCVIAQQPDLRLVIAGNGPVDFWKNLAVDLGIAQSVEFRGHVADVNVLYRDAAVFILPSRREGMSNALLEAQSWGIPAVVSDIPGNRAVVNNDENGLVVPVGDAMALAKAILLLMKNYELRIQLGRGARARAEKEWSITSIASQVVDVYKQLAIVKGGT